MQSVISASFTYSKKSAERNESSSSTNIVILSAKHCTQKLFFKYLIFIWAIKPAQSNTIFSCVLCIVQNKFCVIDSKCGVLFDSFFIKIVIAASVIIVIAAACVVVVFVI